MNESNSSAVGCLVLGCRRRNVTGELEAVSASAASVWPHSCLSQLRRPACDVVAESPSSAIKSSSFAGVVHPMAATRVYWLKGLSLIAFRRTAVSICPDYHGDLLWLFCCALRSANPARHPERFASRLVTRQPVSNTGPFSLPPGTHCHRNKACHCKSPRYFSSGCSCRQFPSLTLHHLQILHPRSFHREVCVNV
jgi:hypothetical protein